MSVGLILTRYGFHVHLLTGIILDIVYTQSVIWFRYIHIYIYIFSRIGSNAIFTRKFLKPFGLPKGHEGCNVKNVNKKSTRTTVMQENVLLYGQNLWTPNL